MTSLPTSSNRVVKRYCGARAAILLRHLRLCAIVLAAIVVFIGVPVSGSVTASPVSALTTEAEPGPEGAPGREDEPVPEPADEPLPAPRLPAPAPPSSARPEPTLPIASPVISQPTEGSLVGDSIALSGTAQPGSELQLLAAIDSSVLCTLIVDDDGAWACSIALPSSAQTAVLAVQRTPGSDDRQARVGFSVLNAPTAEAGGGGDVSAGTLMGTAEPRAEVTALLGDHPCQTTASGDGSWFCTLSRGIESGDYALIASQTTPWSGGRSSAFSPPRTITVDVDAPAAPTMTSPVGSVVPLSGATFAGTGEPGATVTVFGGSHSLCQTVVPATGSWSCAGAPLPASTYAVSAIQQDRAGNISAPSATVMLQFSTARPSSPAPNPSEAPRAPNTRAPVIAPSTAEPPAEGAPEEVAPADRDTAGIPASSEMPAGGWADATWLSHALQPVFGQPGSTEWGFAVSLGLALLGLLVIPSWVLARTIRRLRGTGSAPSEGMRPRLSGRNRARNEYDRAPDIPLAGGLTATFTLLAAAVITFLSGPVDDQPAYLRLLSAVTLAILVVNAIAMIVPAMIARYAFGEHVPVRLAPSFLLVSIATTAVSRVLGLDPVLLFGLVFGLGFAVDAGTALRGKIGAIQVGALTILGTGAWLLSGVLPSAPALMQTILTEFVNTISLAALGAAAVLILPLGRLAGRAILRWSPAAWLGIAVVIFTLLGGLLAPSLVGLGGGSGLVLLGLGSFGFAAASLAFWLWARFIRPVAERA